FPASALEIVRYAVPAHSVEGVLYGGELFDSRAALERGLSTEMFDGDVLEAAGRMCGRLASPPTIAFETIKTALKAPAVERAQATLEPLRRALLDDWCAAGERRQATPEPLRRAFVDAWYAPEARRRIGEARVRLGA